MVNKAYKVTLSSGDPIPIDADELPKIMQAVKTGSPALVRRGIFNPSFLVSVTEDRARTEMFLEDTKYDKKAREYGVKPLKDLFEEVRGQLKLSDGS